MKKLIIAAVVALTATTASAMPQAWLDRFQPAYEISEEIMDASGGDLVNFYYNGEDDLVKELADAVGMPVQYMNYGNFKGVIARLQSLFE